MINKIRHISNKNERSRVGTGYGKSAQLVDNMIPEHHDSILGSARFQPGDEEEQNEINPLSTAKM